MDGSETPAEASAEPSRDSDAQESGPSRELPSLDMELDCPICCCLLCEPSTTHCGHAFCSPCLRAVMAVDARCPSCRAQLPEHSGAAVSVLLASLIERFSPVEYAARRGELAAQRTQSEAASALPAAAPLLSLPSTPLLPGQRCAVRLSSPAHLRLLHSLFAGREAPQRRLVALTLGSGSTSAVLARVHSAAALPGSGGVVHVVLHALQRARLGQQVQEEEDAHDVPVYALSPLRDAALDAASRAEAELLARELRLLCGVWCARVRSCERSRGAAQGPNSVSALLSELGAPPGEDPAALSFWACALLNPTTMHAFTCVPDIRAAALECVETRARLMVVTQAMQASLGAMGAITQAETAWTGAASAVSDGVSRGRTLFDSLYASRRAQVAPQPGMMPRAAAPETNSVTGGL